MVNIEEIHHRLSEIKEALDYLESSHEQMRSSRDKFLLGRYFLQVMLEAVFTIGNQIISDAGLRKPSNYKDILLILKENGIISANEHETMIKFADLRNRLVHTYWKISSEELLEISSDLMIFHNFSGIIVRYISKK
ncbi:DUF86 domain-containing protein [Candidatus Saganbacteria bacterium]|nr:DUF86 domain-containing protein [Candidatus Saganbacteria bacterium]